MPSVGKGRAEVRYGVALLLAAVGPLGLAGAGIGTSGHAAPPALPAQPGVVAGRSSCAPEPETEWRLVRRGPATGTLLALDPWQRCRLWRADDAQSLQRSTDDGATWRPVFHDTVQAPLAVTDPTCAGSATCSASTPPFTEAALVEPSPDSLVVGESANGDSMVRSDDAGASWSLSDRGIAGNEVQYLAAGGVGGHDMYATATADSYGYSTVYNAAFGSASSPGITGPSSLPFVFASHDSGRSWTRTTIPLPDGLQADSVNVSDVSVDPEDGRRVYVLLNLDNDTALLGSSDGGATFNVMFEDHATAWQVLATYAEGQHRVYLSGALSKGTLLVSMDGGGSWQTLLAASPLSPFALAAVPGNNDDMVMAGVFGGAGGGYPGNGELRAFASTAGFMVPSRTVPLPPVELPPNAFYQQLGQRSPFDRNGSGCGGGSICGPPEQAVQLDASGDVLLSSFDNTSACYSACVPHQYYWEAHAAFTTVQPTPTHPSAPSGATIMTQLGICTLPEPDAIAGWGSIAFDGVDIIYGEPQSYPGPNRVGLGDYQEKLLRVRPGPAGGCTADQPIALTFSKQQLDAVAVAMGGHPGDFQYPLAAQITYDARHNGLWLTLSSKNVDTGFGAPPNNLVPIFFATYTDQRGAAFAAGRADLRFMVEACTEPSTATGRDLAFFAYRYSENRLYTCAGPSGETKSYAPLVRLNPDTGVVQSTCMAAVVDSYNNDSDWGFGGDTNLYVASEDDKTLRAYRADDCDLIATLQHRAMDEPNGETDQMACDPFTFAGGTLAVPGSSVVWLRDDSEGSGIMSAYQLATPCPWPTNLTITGPRSVALGIDAPVCVSLSQAGRGVTLGGRTIAVTVDRRPAGAVTTGQDSGTACTTVPASLLPPGAHTITAEYAGDPLRYQPAGAALGLTVLPGANSGAPAPPSGVRTTGGLLPPLRAETQPGPPESGSSPPEVQAITQAQSQAQAQASSQMQPGFMVQPRTREQVATQVHRLGQSQPEPMLAARRLPSAQVAVTLLAGSLLLALGLGRPVRAPALRRRTRLR